MIRIAALTLAAACLAGCATQGNLAHIQREVLSEAEDAERKAQGEPITYFDAKGKAVAFECDSAKCAEQLAKGRKWVWDCP